MEISFLLLWRWDSGSVLTSSYKSCCRPNNVLAGSRYRQVVNEDDCTNTPRTLDCLSELLTGVRTTALQIHLSTTLR